MLCQLEADLAMAVATFEPFLSDSSTRPTSVLHQPAFAMRHYTHTRPYNYNRPVITTTPTIDRATLALSLDQNASSLLQAVHWSFQIQRS